MPKITVLPHPLLCPQGTQFEVNAGENLLACLLRQGIAIEHACEFQVACGTCHVYLRKGYDSVLLPSSVEEAVLDQVWGLESDSRLSCNVRIGQADLTVEIPKYSRNQ